MKNILVISDPPAAPGYLPRLRYLCDFLVRQGYGVTLLTEQYEPLAFAHTYPILTIPMYSGSLIDWTIKTAWTLLTDWHNRVFAKRSLQAEEIKQQTFDVVLCTAFSDFPLGAAAHIARRLQVPLICDIRDLDEQVDGSHYQYRHQQWWTRPLRNLYRAIHIRRRNRVLRMAQAVTTVSPWHATFIRQYNKNVQVVYNGYDSQQFYPEKQKSERFTIRYIGSLHEWQKPGLEKVKQSIAELGIPIDLDIHTPQHHPLKHTELGNMIRKSSMMLVLTSEQTHGMLTTKFYEALGCQRPILCVPSDQGDLAELIRYTNAGIATNDTEVIKRFILEKYQEWASCGYTTQAVRHAEEFTRETQSAHFLPLL